MVEMTTGGVVIPNHPSCHPERREGSHRDGGGSSGGKKRKRREISPDGRDDNGESGHSERREGSHCYGVKLVLSDVEGSTLKS